MSLVCNSVSSCHVAYSPSLALSPAVLPVEEFRICAALDANFRHILSSPFLFLCIYLYVQILVESQFCEDSAGYSAVACFFFFIFSLSLSAALVA